MEVQHRQNMSLFIFKRPAYNTCKTILHTSEFSLTAITLTGHNDFLKRIYIFMKEKSVFRSVVLPNVIIW